MSTRWFFSPARQGVAAEGPAAQTIQPQVVFKRSTAAGAITAAGPASCGWPVPDDVAAIDRSLIMREEPPPGTPAAAENIMAAVEFAYADLPWLLSTKQEPVPGGAGRRVYPWLVLVVLSEDEAAPPRDAEPAPILTAPLAALPPLNESWAWAHVEARLDDTVQDSGPPKNSSSTACAGDPPPSWRACCVRGTSNPTRRTSPPWSRHPPPGNWSGRRRSPPRSS